MRATSKHLQIQGRSAKHIFILQMPRNMLSLFKRFGRRVFQNRTSSSCKTLGAKARATKRMITLYYKIWVDCIIRATSIPGNKQNWKLMTMIFMTTCMTLNLLLFMTVLQKHILHNYFYKINCDFLPERIENIVSFAILFVCPPAILNYLLIFQNDRYKKLLKKYRYHNGKLFLTYFSISMFLPLALLIAGIISGHIGLAY